MARHTRVARYLRLGEGESPQSLPCRMPQNPHTSLLEGWRVGRRRGAPQAGTDPVSVPQGRWPLSPSGLRVMQHVRYLAPLTSRRPRARGFSGGAPGVLASRNGRVGVACRVWVWHECELKWRVPCRLYCRSAQPRGGGCGADHLAKVGHPRARGSTLLVPVLNSR